MAAWRVPFVDPREHYRRIKPELDGAFLDCLTNGDLIQRRHLSAFEKHFADFCGTRHCVGLNSGYHALALSLLAAGVGPGHEVITVAHTFVATVSAIVHAGATPVLVDVAEDYNMNMDLVAKAITPRTRCILPVHLNGRVCDMERLQKIADKHNILIIEDAAQAIGGEFKGKRAGSFGLAGCFSFYPFKMLGCAGDGGAVTTNNPAIARAVTLLRFNGEDRETGEYHCHGYTALLDNVQAAMLDVKLRYLPQWIAHRRHIAGLYHKALSGIPEVRIPKFAEDHCFDVFQNYVIRVPRRDELKDFLNANGVEIIVSWPKPMWRHLALRLGEQNLPETEAVCREVLSLPMSAETTEEHVQITAELVRKFCAGT
jgi:dTDP-4-amino-4,6-dideoxygalactose transaminase